MVHPGSKGLLHRLLWRFAGAADHRQLQLATESLCKGLEKSSDRPPNGGCFGGFFQVFSSKDPKEPGWKWWKTTPKPTGHNIRNTKGPETLDHNLLGPSCEAALPGEAERLLAAQVESFRNRRAPLKCWEITGANLGFTWIHKSLCWSGISGLVWKIAKLLVAKLVPLWLN